MWNHSKPPGRLYFRVNRAGGTLPTIFSETEKMLFVAKKMVSCPKGNFLDF